MFAMKLRYLFRRCLKSPGFLILRFFSLNRINKILNNEAGKDVFQARKTVSDLILKVLAKNICVREAIKRFPLDVTDESIICSWHALVHYEADEDIRRRSPDYSEEQDSYLEMIAYILRDGLPLPENIIKGYNEYHEMALIPRSPGFISVIKSLLRFTI